MDDEIRDYLATFFSLRETEVYIPRESESIEEGFLAFRMVTFLKRMESRGRVEGEIGDLSEKIDKEFKREGSRKAGSSLGLVGMVFYGVPEGSVEEVEA